MALIMSMLLLFQNCKKDDNSPSSGNVTEYSSAVSELNTSLVDFIGVAQKFETTDVTTLPIDEVKSFMDSYIQAGEQLVTSLNAAIAAQNNKKASNFKNSSDGPSCSAYDLIPGTDSGLSPALAKAVGDLIAETKGEVNEIQQKWKSGEIDDNTYYAAMNQLKIDKPLKAAHIGFGAIMGGGAAIVVGAATAPLSLSVVATVAVVTGTGAVVGSACTWLAHWYTSNKNGEPVYYISSGTTPAGKSLPLNLFGENATVIISPNGYSPVAINNYELPASGINQSIEIEGVKLEDADAGGSTEVCFYNNEMEKVNCDEVEFVTGGPNPPDPGPGEGVTVVATLVPIAENCNISFSIVGTDGYSNSATTPSNASGQASFYIPGGAEGVVDHVTISSSNGKTYTVTYVF